MLYCLFIFIPIFVCYILYKFKHAFSFYFRCASEINSKMAGKEEKQDVETKEDGGSGNAKKPFDKKQYRLKKYSNKYKLDKWEKNRKKKLMRDYYKEVKNDPMAGSYKPKSFDEEETVTDSIGGRFVRHPDLIEKEVRVKKKRDPFLNAKKKYEQIKQDKMERLREIKKKRAEKQRKLAEYKKKKADRFKMLSRRTKKGQPVINGKLQLLLNVINVELDD